MKTWLSNVLLAITCFTAPQVLLGVSIVEKEYEGRAHFEITTEKAIYYYDLAGGGFSRLLDRDGADWISFHTEPLNVTPASAAAGYRGIPNLLFGRRNEDAGAGHPGHEQCASVRVTEDTIRTVSKSGRWRWTWRFTESNAIFTMESAESEHPWWFLYEGTIGGRWSPSTHYWGTDTGGPYRSTPDSNSQRFDRWRSVYFGDDASNRVFAITQVENDEFPDTLWFMGNTALGLESPDGMVVFGFGRGPNGKPQLRGAGERFVLGLIDRRVSDATAHAQVIQTINSWSDKSLHHLQNASYVRVSSTTLWGDMECFKVETPHATYLYGKRGAGFASILDRDGHDWISYRHGGKSAGEYRGLPKCGQPVKFFHCGYGFGHYSTENEFESSVTLDEPAHIRIHSETKKGDAIGDWDFYPTHATFTLQKIPGDKYWFLYEGTPGGTLDMVDDFTIRSGGQQAPLREPWKQTVPWVVFGAQESPQRMVLMNHQSNSPVDSYVSWPYKASPMEPLSQMTVFGFGRPDWQDAEQHSPQLSEFPAAFSVSFTSAVDKSSIVSDAERLRKLAIELNASNNATSYQNASPSSPPLASQCQAFLQLIAEQKSPGWETMAPVDARKTFLSLDSLFGKGPHDVVSDDRMIDGRIPIRIYKPTTAKSDALLPVVVYFHGGGWVLGSIETHDALCRRLCSEAQCAIVSVGYRLAPEHPYPAPLDDCYESTCFTVSQAIHLGVDPTRLIVAGDSAGGNLAAAVALEARDRACPSILAQILIYPALDSTCSTNSYRSFAQGYGLTLANMQWFWKQYLGEHKSDSYASPGKMDSLKDLPQASVITAQYDVLRDEGEEFAKRLRADGVRVDLRRYDGMIHGFIHFAGAFDEGKSATIDIARAIRSYFGNDQ